MAEPVQKTRIIPHGPGAEQALSVGDPLASMRTEWLPPGSEEAKAAALEERPLPTGKLDDSLDTTSGSMDSEDQVDRELRDEALRDLADRSSEYQLGEQIGEGGQGEIWEALQVDLGRAVAVKTAKDKPWLWGDFLKEAFATAQLDHPNIVPVHSIGALTMRVHRAPMIVMKRVRGRCWAEVIAEERKAPDFSLGPFLRKHAAILLDVCNAVAYAHSKGILHRDLKPGQVMIGDFGEVYLLDWGLAVSIKDGKPLDVTRFGPGRVEKARLFTLETASNPAGTPAYMAPEQADFNTIALGFHTDVYLLGAVLYELVSGRPPHIASTPLEAMRKAQRGEIPPIPTGTPEGLRDLVLRALEPSPIKRMRHAVEFRDALAAYLSGADREHESRQITAGFDVAALDDYESLSDASKRLSQALQLWPENPEIEACRDRLLVRFAEVALAHGDILLARLQAERIGNAGLAREWEERADKAEERAARDLPAPPLFTPARAAALAAVYAVLLASILWVVAVGRQTVREEVHQQVQSLAQLAAATIDAGHLQAVDTSRDIRSSQFQRTLSQLSAFRTANPDVRFVYTMRPLEGGESNEWVTLVDIDPLDMDLDGDGQISPDEQGNPPGTPYPFGVPAMREAITDGVPTSSEVQDNWGHFISGFAPVRETASGDPYAVVGIDVTMEAVKGKARRLYAAAAGAAALLLLLVTVAMLSIFRSGQSLARVRALEEELQKRSTELRGRRLHLG